MEDEISLISKDGNEQSNEMPNVKELEASQNISELDKQICKDLKELNTSSERKKMIQELQKIKESQYTLYFPKEIYEKCIKGIYEEDKKKDTNDYLLDLDIERPLHQMNSIAIMKIVLLIIDYITTNDTLRQFLTPEEEAFRLMIYKNIIKNYDKYDKAFFFFGSTIIDFNINKSILDKLNIDINCNYPHFKDVKEFFSNNHIMEQDPSNPDIKELIKGLLSFFYKTIVNKKNYKDKLPKEYYEYIQTLEKSDKYSNNDLQNENKLESIIDKSLETLSSQIKDKYKDEFKEIFKEHSEYYNDFIKQSSSIERKNVLEKNKNFLFASMFNNMKNNMIERTPAEINNKELENSIFKSILTLKNETKDKEIIPTLNDFEYYKLLKFIGPDRPLIRFEYDPKDNKTIIPIGNYSGKKYTHHTINVKNLKDNKKILDSVVNIIIKETINGYFNDKKYDKDILLKIKEELFKRYIKNSNKRHIAEMSQNYLMNNLLSKEQISDNDRTYTYSSIIVPKNYKNNEESSDKSKEQISNDNGIYTHSGMIESYKNYKNNKKSSDKNEIITLKDNNKEQKKQNNVINLIDDTNSCISKSLAEDEKEINNGSLIDMSNIQQDNINSINVNNNEAETKIYYSGKNKKEDKDCNIF